MFFLIHKPSGITSFKLIKEFAKKYKFNSIGHTGTLDPLASGAILVATNSDTKLISYISDKTKSYEAVGVFGFASNTLDITGEITSTKQPPPSLEELEKALKHVFNQSSQIPPTFSAKKVNGIRSYKIARQRKSVDLKPVSIKVLDWELISYNNNEFCFRVTVSAGTYIRSLIRDIGNAVGCAAIMKSLYRYKISGLFLRSQVEKIADLSLFTQKQIVVSRKQIYELLQGNSKSLGTITELFCLMFQNKVIGFVQNEGGKVRLRLLGKKIMKLLENKF